ncbi:M56 family metallopeptidase [Flavobacterium sp.]|uniref:M56 family metallopeptidase n=1 Tax=Flavobacterium sp. TaxID=239 RepID=UPI002B8191B9|nr:M56 family metallopeptidase [Flavobacterium sp.]HSD07884.1 M56 family metallopeptidase [Flavobacterium sp.]
METIFVYIAKSSGLIALFYVAYYLLLHKETFFTGNRWFLLAGLFTSAILPFLFYTKIVWINPTPMPDLNFRHNFIPPILEKESFEINWNYIVLAIYSIGFLVFLIKFAMDFYSLNLVLRTKKIKQQADFKFIDTTENIAPFSYFNYIVYNASLYNTVELENIIEHEKVHSEQNHTADVIISRVFCILFWFNPIIWLYKKAIIQNLEFIADNEAAKKLSDKKVYQYTLLKITTHENCIAITNHFYQSLIKKRIVMLNKNQSKRKNSWKYLLVFPALIAFVLLFQIEVIAKEKPLIIKETVGKVDKVKSMDIYKIQKSTTDIELKQIAERLKLKHDVAIVISNVKRNSKDQLTNIKVAVQKGTQEAQTIQIDGENAIKDCGIIIITEQNGSKKINLFTNNKSNDSTVCQDVKVEEKKVLNSNINTNVNDNINTHSKSDIAINTDINTTVNVNTNIQTNSSASTNPILVIDGKIAPRNMRADDIDPFYIKSITVYNSTQALFKYGNTGGNSVIEVVTKQAEFKNGLKLPQEKDVKESEENLNSSK